MCTANKIINGKQCTIQQYVDGNKFTHVSEYVITVVIDIMEKQFEELVVSHVNKCTCLKMDI